MKVIHFYFILLYRIIIIIISIYSKKVAKIMLEMYAAKLKIVANHKKTRNLYTDRLSYHYYLFEIQASTTIWSLSFYCGEGNVCLNTFVYVWQEFLTENFRWSSTRGLVTPVDAYTLRTHSRLNANTAPHQATWVKLILNK